MANIRILARDGHKDAVLTATSEAGGLVIENTQDARRAYVWRSETTSNSAWSSQTITAVLPVTVLGLGALVLSNTNLTESATVSAVLKNGMSTVDTVTPECLGENADGTTTWVAWFTVATSVDQYELTIDDASNPDGYLEIVQILCGPALSPTYNPDYGVDLTWREDVQHITTAGQSTRSEGTGLVRREMGMALEKMLDADRIALIENLITAGQRATIFISLYPGLGGDIERHHQFACRRITHFQTARWTYKFWRGGLEFREV